ncbi:MAG TPA: extradiol ring-cleavage dioxygenase [Marinobacter sp.]|nr:extradiol ring-cleavage dioxygenase [Marinobacter sp.]
MKRDVVERVLWNLSVDRFSKEKFRENPEKFLGRFALDDECRQMILNFEVDQMQKLGVNPMLTIGYWMEMAPDRRISSYNRKLRADSVSSHSASPKR